MIEDLFKCISKEDDFEEKSYIILSSKQEKYNSFHPLFVKWATYTPCKSVKKIINSLYNWCTKYLDKWFGKKFPQVNLFKPCLWELFLCNFLQKKGFILDSKKKEDWTPDFCILYEDKKIWVEAKSPAEHNSIEQLYNWTHNLLEISIPRYLRLSSSFEDKSKYWENMYLKNWCNESDSYIIAINWNDIDSWRTDKWISGILYWIWLDQFDKYRNKSYKNLNSLPKKWTEDIKIWYFNKPEYSHISWVIYLEDEYKFIDNEVQVEYSYFQFIPNINAINPVSKEFIKKLGMHVPKIFE